MVYIQLNGKWAVKYDKCISCGTTKYKHVARGYCKPCQYKITRQNKLSFLSTEEIINNENKRAKQIAFLKSKM